MPASVTVAPDACRRFRVSPNQAHATKIASTGSSIPVIPARVALMWRSAETTSANGTEDVARIRDRGQRRCCETGAVRTLRFPEFDDQHQAGECQHVREPDATTHVLAVDEA